MIALYSEHDAYAAGWLRALMEVGLVEPGEVDERDIQEVRPADLVGRGRVHLFAGVGGWDLALRLAGWPAGRPVWTGSCPCQPYSSAGKGLGEKDPRDLWPHMRRLVAECRPDTVFGEQVPGAIGHGWLDRVRRDLEAAGYAVGAVVLGAHSVGAPHIRQRLYWVAHREGDRREQGRRAVAERAGLGDDGDFGVVAHPDGERGGRDRGAGDSPEAGGRGTRDSDGVRGQYGSGTRGPTGILGDASGEGREGRSLGRIQRGEPASDAIAGRLADALCDGRGQGGLPAADGVQPDREGATVERGDGGPLDAWADHELIPCRDGKVRRTQPGLQPLAHGIPAKRSDPRLGHLVARLVELGHSPKAARRMVREARGNRVGRLRGYGNAVVPQCAAVLVRAFLESEGHQ